MQCGHEGIGKARIIFYLSRDFADTEYSWPRRKSVHLEGSRAGGVGLHIPFRAQEVTFQAPEARQRMRGFHVYSGGFWFCFGVIILCSAWLICIGNLLS